MPAGRPSTFREEYIEQTYKLALLKCTEAEIADVFRITTQGFDKWKKAHPELVGALARGKLIADAHIAERLSQRAAGYSHDAVKIFMPAGADEPVYAHYVEHYPPDTQAASLWLRNRQPGKWRDRVEHTGADGDAITINLVKFSERSEPVTIEHKPDEGKS